MVHDSSHHAFRTAGDDVIVRVAVHELLREVGGAAVEPEAAIVRAHVDVCAGGLVFIFEEDELLGPCTDDDVDLRLAAGTLAERHKGRGPGTADDHEDAFST